ncbi:hypothetical protein EV681_4608 [Advenella incenata]|uniref:Plasmid-related protein n=1 Tax=Advenella incenata TaxID=267800 RepID=A0A4Q7V6I4_9BURK|nr:DNA-binding protein [Advenella incenata]RZT91020.1 hypothetical protein EV681_4608 [Advenella incenata]
MEESKTEKILLERFGGSPLLTLHQVAQILLRSPEGLRITISGNSYLAEQLNSCKLKIGRRIYFKLTSIAQLIDEAE